MCAYVFVYIYTTSSLYSIFVGSCFCIHSASLCLLVGEFNPFTFKVIIDMYVLIALLLIVLDLFLLIFSGPLSLGLFSSLLFSCGLMTIFSVVFELHLL